jgi:hypothetical protein
VRIGLLVALACGLAGCAYHIGQGLTEGAFDELNGDGRSGGLARTSDLLLERKLVAELGHQLGQGLVGGAMTIDPDDQAQLERTIDALLTVAARRTGAGLRAEVSPELREMVQRDIVGAFAEGLRGDIGNSAEALVERIVLKAMSSLEGSLEEPQLRETLADLLRESVYYALQEERSTPGVGSALETTLSEHLLTPLESSVGGLSELVAKRIDESARRTEKTLQAVIGALVVMTSVIAMLYFIRNRQVRRLEEQNTLAERGLRNIDAALALLDPGTRAAVVAKLEEYESVEARDILYPKAPRSPPHVVPRSDDYERRD